MTITSRGHAIRFHEVGGPEVLRWEAVEVGEPGPGQARVRHAAVGLNFIDVYHRSGLYPVPLPSGLGSEAAGVVEAVGPGVTEVAPGDRVAYGTGPLGAYAETRLVPASVLVKLPDAVGFEDAAGLMLKGMTVWYLLRRTRPAQAGETVLLTAAAGGVGLLFCQVARALGVRVIGTVSSAAKAELARAHGCEHPLVVGEVDVAKRVRELTGGAGVPVAYDSVGKDSFPASLDSLAPRGLLVSFGQASGPVPPLDIRVLSQKGSLYLTRPTLGAYTATRAELAAGAEALFGWVASGAVRSAASARFPLREAARAHAALEGRATTGSTVLVP
jgi:NADPH2:quinone reductase